MILHILYEDLNLRIEIDEHKRTNLVIFSMQTRSCAEVSHHHTGCVRGNNWGIKIDFLRDNISIADKSQAVEVDVSTSTKDTQNSKFCVMY